MAFRVIEPPETVASSMSPVAVRRADTVLPAETGAGPGKVKRGHFQARRRNDGTWLLEIAADRKAAEVLSEELPPDAANLCGQIEALRQQLAERAAAQTDLAALLREMIETRERQLEALLARETDWDRRVSSLEEAIAEREEFRRREAELMRERDAARREAEAAAARLRAIEAHAEEAARQRAEARAHAERANAEQLRLRSERETDRLLWAKERRQLSAEIDQLSRRGWLARLRPGKS